MEKASLDFFDVLCLMRLENQMNSRRFLLKKQAESNKRFLLGRRAFLESSGFAWAGLTGLSMLPKFLKAQLNHSAPSAVVPENLDPGTTLWYDRPAKTWLEGMPLGNGRLGAIVLGGVPHEQIMLNEDTLYAEEPGGRDLPLDIAPKFAEVVDLLKQGKYIEANAIVERNWLGRSWPCYQPFGTLHLRLPSNGEIVGYTRQLTLTDAVHRVRYSQNGIVFERETFASFPDDVIVCRLTSDKRGALSLKADFDSQHPTVKQVRSTDKALKLTGQLPGIALRRTLEWVEETGDTWKYPELWNEDRSRKPFAKQILYREEVGNRGMFFEGRLRVLECDGKVNVGNDGLSVEGAQYVTLALAMGSSFNGYAKSPSRQGADPAKRTTPVLDRLKHRSYRQILGTHISDYQKLFQRVSLELADTGEKSRLPTNQRRVGYNGALDPTFAALFFQYGRYLLISCSRPGTQAANLQGIWNVDRIPPWAGAYTVNINIQMNYWGAETANLSECHEPLIEFIQEMSQKGESVAHDMYHRPGWVMHHNTTIWRDAEPVDFHGYVAFWPMAGGWLCQHLWEHYQFTGDKQFLTETAYPIMRSAAEFYDSWLIEDENGYLLTPVSDSPENMFYFKDSEGREQMGGLAMGCTLDIAIIRELFANTITAAKLLDCDNVLQQRLDAHSHKLLPYRVGSRGQLLEWFKEFKDVPPRHNTSPYYPLYPGNQITPRGTPSLAAAERKLLEERARTGGGFPAAWMAGAWARLNQADTGYGYLERLYSRTHPSLLNGSGDIFQIDANLGAMASTVEFFLQSHAGEIELLPALPSVWKTGRVKGLKARGGFTVDMEWRAGDLQLAHITSTNGGHGIVRYKEKTVILNLKPGEVKNLNQNLT
jgi:alpha-L-fucosidase 2